MLLRVFVQCDELDARFAAPLTILLAFTRR